AIHWINRPTFQQVVQTGSTDAWSCHASRVADTVVAGASLAIDGELGPTMLQVGKPKSVCGVAEVNGGGVRNEGAHLACYKAKTTKGQPRHRPAGGTLASSFANGRVSLSPINSICLGAVVDGGSSAVRADGRECFRARLQDSSTQDAEVAVTDASGQRRMKVLRLDSVCLPVATPAGEIVDTSGELACFRTRRASGEPRFPGRDVVVETQLGVETHTLRRDDRVCVAARVTLD
ncbi:MAG: hypothetical protein ABR587_12025, partial [Candidatus Binatia bacterium]